MNTKEKADALVEKFYNPFPTEPHKAINYAIISVEHTISVLDKLESELEDTYDKGSTNDAISEQTELLNELKSRI